MREILFRGKRKDNKKLVYGFLVMNKCSKAENGRLIYYTRPEIIPVGEIGEADYDGDGNYYEYVVIPETVGQYTGVSDRSGKRIFEGDVVESRASENKEDWERWIVTFYDGSFCFERELPRKRKHKHEQNLLCEDEIKLYHLTVIGNIHDNPELLRTPKNDEVRE